ncbi:terminase large subunit [Pseudovibrio sp. Tun.PSC04-5.I4]|uniref:terminase large subunit n=1 Tax=Pseudovibrio sp. Tun.PSC04-5.I4 TaxID=1798213 RepID=UPI0008831BAE|nr:terminase large subunit [Pseudovibrio sp. Tun.PSC04-5.I4]SDR20025.1 Phage terminase-like protein, large subunit, contains N-terminal HTH domain [Pseudovibrio sp. Tun.PSC04-5.I4]
MKPGYWTTACPDWERRIVAGESLVPFAPLYPSEAEAALGVFKSLHIVDVPGMPTFGECCDQWVFDFVGAIFGAYDASTGQRLISEFLLLIAKKNAKSTIAAGIMVTALIRNWRHSNELLLLAPTMEVANNCFNPAAAMINYDEELKTILKVHEHKRTIQHETTGAQLKVVAADSDSISGKKAGFVLVDELWLFGKKPKASAMLQEAIGGLVSRPEGFVVYLTTHSDEPPSGVWKTKLNYYRDVRDGKIDDPERLGVLYEFPKKMIKERDYLKSENFYITNPNLGKSVRKNWLISKLREAMDGSGEDDQQSFLAKHLNVPIGMNLRRDRWAGVDHWEGAGLHEISDLDVLLERCEVVVAGIDGGGLDDLLGFCLIGRERGTNRWLLWACACCHAIALERRKQISEVLRDFQKDGDLFICEEGQGDIDIVSDIIEQVHQAGLFPSENAIGLDPVGVAAILDELRLRGLSDAQMVGVPQGYKLSGVTKGMARKLADHSLVHGGSRMMAWCVSNAKTERRGNADYVTKQVSGIMKIDPLCAAFNAFDLMSRHPVSCGNIDDFLNNPVMAI